MNKKIALILVSCTLLVFIPGQVLSQNSMPSPIASEIIGETTTPEPVSVGTFGEATVPPFCWECQLHQCQPLGPWTVNCNAVEMGWDHCYDGYGNCQPWGCELSGYDSCRMDLRSLGPDGSVRAPQLFGLTDKAIAAMLGSASPYEPKQSRQCDRAVVVRRISADIAEEQRRATSRIGI